MTITAAAAAKNESLPAFDQISTRISNKNTHSINIIEKVNNSE